MTGVAYVCASKLAEQRITMARMDPELHVTPEWRVDRILLPNTDFCFLRASKGMEGNIWLWSPLPPRQQHQCLNVDLLSLSACVIAEDCVVAED